MTRQRGFTLIELVVAVTLLGVMMLLLYSGLTFAMRSWDAAEVAGGRATDQRIGVNFLRRELGETFPMRWKEPTALMFAFEGKARTLRFVSSRPAGLQAGGLSLVGLAAEEDGARGRNTRVSGKLGEGEAPDHRGQPGPECGEHRQGTEAEPPAACRQLLRDVGPRDRHFGDQEGTSEELQRRERGCIRRR